MPPRKRVVLLVNDVFSAYQGTYRASMERAARRHEMRLLVVMGRELAHRDPSERAQNVIFEWVSPQIADGVLALSGTIANFTGAEGLAQLFRRFGGMPTVSIGVAVPGFVSIAIDNRTAQAVAVDHLVREHRRKRIAYIAGPASNEEANDRLAGYRETLARNDLAVDDSLVERAHFTSPSGQKAMREILSRGAPFDAVVAANDAMALGAMEALQDAGLRVPEDVLVVGFDDAPLARFGLRSLTTIAQPVDDVVEAAFGQLLSLMASDETPAPPALRADLVLRESCGCGYSSARTASSTVVPETPAVEYLRAHRDEIAAAIMPAASSPGRGARTPWVPALLDAFIADLEGDAGALARFLERTIEEAAARHTSFEEIGHALLRVQGRLDEAGYRGASQFELEQLCVKARHVVTTEISRKEARAALAQLERSVELRPVSQRLALAFESRSLVAELERSLPSVGVGTAYIALAARRGEGALRPLLALDAGARVRTGLELKSPGQLFPEAFPKADEGSLLVWALTFETEFLGVFAVGGDSEPLVGEAVRGQIGAALKMGELHARVVEQTAIQERLAREQLGQEIAIARRIQTALAPKDLSAPGLDIAVGIQPADVVGGDYFDVLPVPGGCWLAIGDVAGHGLMSGLVVLMIQSIVSALVASRPGASPAELTVDLNRILFPNLRGRLQREEHATFLLLHVAVDGRLRFAGAHEDLIIWRSRTRRCESVPTDGTWLGLVDDIRHATSDREVALEPGDLLVLLTDGVLEARNAKNEHLGLEAVCRIVESHASDPPQAIVAELVAATRAWAPAQQDDVTCVVARFAGRPS